MRLAIETFVCAILISLLVLLGMFNQQVDMNTGNAKQFCSSAINRMESAEFANEVVDRCKSDATASGYRLTVTSAASGDTTTYTTVLTYKVKVPLFQFEREYQIKVTGEEQANRLLKSIMIKKKQSSGMVAVFLIPFYNVIFFSKISYLK